MRKFLIPVILVVLALTALPATQQPPATAQETVVLPLSEQGPYGVGLQTITLQDDSQDGLEYEVYIWYPVEGSAYSIPEYQGEPDWSGAPYPLVIYSHRFGGNGNATNTLGPHLASYGFVVASATHHDNLQHFWQITVDRPRDILFLLEQLVAMAEGPLAGLYDANNVGVAGYSAGGYTALTMNGARVDSAYFTGWCSELGHPTDGCLNWEAITARRFGSTPPESDDLWSPTSHEAIQAVVPMALCQARMYGERGLAAATVPTMVISGTADGICDYTINAAFIYEQMVIEDRALISLIGVNHLDSLQFADVLAAYRHFTTAFLGHMLYHDDAYAEFYSEEYVAGIDASSWAGLQGIVWGVVENE